MKLPPFKLERYFARYEFDVRHLLCSSDCESLSVNDLLALEPGARQALDSLWLGYTESQGAPTLRKAISHLYEAIAPDQVLVHSGAEEAIFLFMQAALAPGDHVIVHWPCYQSLHEVAQSIGCELTFWKADEDQGWSLDPDVLAGHIRPNTRAVIINTPAQPHRLAHAPGCVFAAKPHAGPEGHPAFFPTRCTGKREYSADDRLGRPPAI